MSKTIPALVAVFALAVSASAAEFHVAPNGSDTNPGTQAQPFATLEKVRDAAKSGDRIVLKGGTYQLGETLVLGPQNSGVTWMAASGETPVLSGGVVVTGWTPDKNGIWKAPVSLGNFRQLWVNGQRAQRARGAVPQGMKFWGKYGRTDLVPHARYWDSMRPERRGKFDAEVKLDPLPTGPTAEVILDAKYCPGTLVNFGKAGFTAPDATLADWRNPGDMEFGFFNSWTHSIAKVESITKDAATGVIIEMSQPGFFLCCNKGGVQDQSRLPSYMENAFELLDEPGEWYFDRPARMLYYKPRPGEEMSKAQVIAPRLEQLLLVKGTLDNPVRDMTFNGLTFAHATWLRPSTGMGHPDTQANFIQAHYNGYYRAEFDYAWVSLNGEQVKSPANVVVDTAHRVTFEKCSFTALGGAGLDVQGGAQDNLISRCRFDDIAGNGIQIGDVTRDDHHPSDPRRIVKGNQVLDCLISRTGQDYTDSVGVFYGYTVGTVIAHNEIRDIPYTGITGGWGWGMVDAGGGGYGSAIKFKTPAAGKDNRIEYNHVYQVNQVRDDGGGIYLLGRQPGTVIRGNHIHDSRHGRGVYLDEGTADVEVYNNLIYRVHGPVHCNNASQNRIATCKIHDNLTTPPAGVKLVPGMKGSALKAGSLVDEPVQPFPSVFTVAAHVRLNKYPEGADARRWIVCRGGNELTAGNLSLFVDGRNVAAYLNTGGAFHTATGSDNSLHLNQWTPVAASYDGDTLRVFCNGKEVAAKKIGKPYQPANAPLTFGARGDRFTMFDCGDIDEASLFDRVLTPAEMRDFPAAGAVRHWPFDTVPAANSPADEISRNAGPRSEK
jgi:hypothetical protein